MLRLLILLCACATAFGALPKGWKACSKSDPKFSDCLSKEIEKAIKSLVKGDKSLGVMPLDPLRINKIGLSKGRGPVSMELSLEDADVHGISMLQVKDTKTDWKTMNVKVTVPKIVVLSNYKVDGKVLILPITGQGKGNLTLDDLSLNIESKWNRIKKGNTEYFNMESLTVPLEPKRLYIRLENLFNGDKVLGENMNKFLNQNWGVLLDELREPVSEALSAVFIQIANQVLNKIPASEIDK
ncbi:protein takeout [Halyomorpha halys]|uniref:protein takeout n=1 Tax=Halyomorpha halys TaxID=286706 RepID=UPI0006D51A7C|nr:protein takeout [Halyomorpha halys]